MSAPLPERMAVIGLGKLGLPIACCLAAKGHQVIGVDLDRERVAALRRGSIPLSEPGLEGLHAQAGGRFTVTEDVHQAIVESAISFIVVPTPSDEDGAFSLRHVLAVCEQVGEGLRHRTDRHVVVVTSTVLPGAMDRDVQPLLEQRAGAPCGVGFGLCYSPVFVALGSVTANFLKPDFLLIGESDPQSGERLASIYQRTCENAPPIIRMNFVNAELTKLAVNSFITSKIAFANMLARLCERFPGANVDVVTQAMGLDRRIGEKYLKGAVSYGGPCFPRDNVAFGYVARQAGLSAALPETTHLANQQDLEALVSLAQVELPAGGVVGVLGLAYKPETDVIEGSPGIELTRRLLAEGIPVVAYDPMAMRQAQAALGSRVAWAASIVDCVQRADVVVIMTPCHEFREIPHEQWKRPHQPRVVIDCWRILEWPTSVEGVKYLPLGIGLQPASTDGHAVVNASRRTTTG